MFTKKIFTEKAQPIILCFVIATSFAIILGTGIVQDTTPPAVLAQNNNLSSTPSNSASELLDSVTKNSSDIEQLLGQPFYVENTKATNMRVISVDTFPSVEVSYIGNSTINGSPTQTIGTVVDTMDSDGAVHSEGKAVILTVTGQVITYKTKSIGYYNPDGSFSNSGIILFGMPLMGSTNSSNENSTKNLTGSQSNPSEEETGSSEFNNLLGIYKKTVDPFGNGLTKVWKWS